MPRSLVSRLVAVAAAALLSLGAIAPSAFARQVDGGAVTAARAASAPASCAADGTYVWAHLASCGWPGPSNTGAHASACPGGVLKNVGTNDRAVYHLRTPNQVLSCQLIRGCISVEATNVTLKNVYVRCTSGRTGEDANGTGVVKVLEGASAKLTDVSVRGLRGNHACVWHEGASVSIDRMNCRGVNDGVFSWATSRAGSGNNFSLTNSYLHDFTTKTANGHVDGYQTEGASHGAIADNTFLMTTDSRNESNSAIAIWNGRRSSSDIDVTHNLIAGGGFAVYAEDLSPSEANPAGGYTVTDVHFSKNVFSKRLFGCVGYYGVWFPRGKPTDGWNRSGNKVLESSSSVDASNPTSGGRACN